MPARFFVGNGNAPREEVAPPSHVDLTAPPIPPTSQENIRRQAQRVRRHTHGAQPRSTPRHQSRSSHIPPFPAPQNFSPQTQTTHPTPPRSSHEQTLALTLTSALVTAWSLRAHSIAVFLGNACVHVNLLLLAETAMRSFAKPSVAYANRIDADRHPRDAPAFLVLDTVALALVTLHSLQVCGFVRFADPKVAIALVAAWPASIANWTSRLAMETTAFDALSRAVAAKEVAAMRLATQVRRLGGARCLPPDANAFARFWRWCACMWDSAKLMAESGSGRTFRRAMLACSLADWGLLLGAWTALGIQGAATHGAWVQPHSAVVPLAAFLCLDATRLGCQLAHSRLLRRLRTRRLGERPATGASSFVRTPAGMTTGLTRWVFFGNIACFVAVAALGCGGGCWRVPVPPGTTAISLLLLARFHRLMIEGAYLSATLLAKVVDRSGELPVFDLPGADAGGGGYASSISPRYLAPQRNELMGKRPRREAKGPLGVVRAGLLTKIESTGRTLDEFLTGFGRARVDQFGPPGAIAEAATTDPNAGLSLGEFTEAISTGLRGHLAGKGAEDAAKTLFDEMTSGGKDGRSVGLNEIKEWLKDQPPLDAATPGASSGSSGSVDEGERDSEGERDRWRASVQRVLLQFVESRDRVTSAVTKTFEDIQGHVLPMMPAPHPPKPARRGLRLLSLEGGGIKGLTLIWQLRALERAAGKPIHELFDLIGGVSTGGIIALAIARGTSLDDLERMYWDIARLVFGKQSAVRQLIKGHAGENDEIRRLLVEGLGDLPMITDDPDQRVKCFVVSTQQTDRLEVRLIRTYRNPNKGRDQNENWAQWEAGMATSSAPTVFPPFIRTDERTGDKATFIDGALSGYNNPSSLVLNEGLDIAEPGQRIDVLLSLGCGEAKGAMGDNPFWIVGQVINLAFDTELQEAHVASMIARFSPQTSHVRLNPPTAHYSLTEHRVDVLTRMEDDTRRYLAATQPVFEKLAARLAPPPGVDEARDEEGAASASNNMVSDLSRVPAAAASYVDEGMASMRSWIDESFQPGKAR